MRRRKKRIRRSDWLSEAIWCVHSTFLPTTFFCKWKKAGAAVFPPCPEICQCPLLFGIPPWNHINFTSRDAWETHFPWLHSLWFTWGSMQKNLYARFLQRWFSRKKRKKIEERRWHIRLKVIQTKLHKEEKRKNLTSKYLYALCDKFM